MNCTFMCVCVCVCVSGSARYSAAAPALVPDVAIEAVDTGAAPSTAAEQPLHVTFCDLLRFLSHSCAF